MPYEFNLSVIIPSYNRLWSLPRAVESCRGTRCTTEIIVVDDGSTDGTWQWLKDQPDVVRLRQDNWGKTWAVNRGLAQARGEYIRFLDSDDWTPAGANDGQYEIARSSGADIVVAGQEIYDEQGRLQATVDWTTSDDFVAQQLGECDSSHYSAYLFRHEFIREIPHRPDFCFADDRLLVIEAAIAGPKVAVYPAPGLCFRHHDQARLQFVRGLRQTVTQLQHLTVYKKTLALLAQRGQLTSRRKNAACPTLWRLACRIAKTDPEEACEVVDWIYQLNPSFRPPESRGLSWSYRRLGFRFTQRLLRLRRRLLAPLRRPLPRLHEFPS